MKTKLLPLLVLPLLLLAQDQQSDMQWVDSEIAAIKPPRKGIPPSALTGMVDPFTAQLRLNQPQGTLQAGNGGAFRRFYPRGKFALQAVINSRSVLINGKWYKRHDMVNGYRIEEITRNGVRLQKKKKTLTLSLITKNDKIKIKAK